MITDESLADGRAEPHRLLRMAYGDFAPAVLGYLRSLGVDDPEAVMQDVFIAVYPRLTKVKGGVNGLRMLIFSIAHARAVDHHRRRARTPQLVEYDPTRDERTVASAEDELLRSTGRAGALALLETLAADQREVVSLRVIADLSLEQTAIVMKKSTGAVKQLQRRALLNLRDQLEQKAWERT